MPLLRHAAALPASSSHRWMCSTYTPGRNRSSMRIGPLAIRSSLAALWAVAGSVVRGTAAAPADGFGRDGTGGDDKSPGKGACRRMDGSVAVRCRMDANRGGVCRALSHAAATSDHNAAPSATLPPLPTGAKPSD